MLIFVVMVTKLVQPESNFWRGDPLINIWFLFSLFSINKKHKLTLSTSIALLFTNKTHFKVFAIVRSRNEHK
jgi:hypothetical protein